MLWYYWAQIWHLARVLEVRKGEMEGGKNHQFFSSLCAIWKIYGNVKIPRPSSGVRYSPDSKNRRGVDFSKEKPALYAEL